MDVGGATVTVPTASPKRSARILATAPVQSARRTRSAGRKGRSGGRRQKVPKR